MLALIITAIRIDRNGARVEFAGGHVIEYRREVEAETPPSLPPLATVDAAGECVSDNVVPFRRVGT